MLVKSCKNSDLKLAFDLNTQECRCYDGAPCLDQFNMCSVIILILAIAAKDAEGATKAFQVSGTGDSRDEGFYIEDEDETHFKKIGEPDEDGDYYYLWLDEATWFSNGGWKMGDGKNFSEVDVWYFAEGGQLDAPPTSGWKYDDLFSQHAEQPNNIRVKPFPSLVSTSKQTEEAGGSLTMEGGVLCLDEKDKWIHVREVCARKKFQCQNQMDRNACLDLDLVSTRSQTVEEGGSWKKDGGIVCVSQDRGWKHLTNKQVCDATLDCRNDMDEIVCFEKKMNQTENIILNGVGPAFAGVYKREHWHDIEYYAQGGKLGLIYQPSKEQGLVIGTGENIWTATALFKRIEGETVWRYVEDGSLTGRSADRRRDPDVQLTWIPETFNQSLLENRTLFEQETLLGEGVGLICLAHKEGSTELEKTFISFKDKAGGRCDGDPICQHGGDEKGCNEASLINATEMILVNGVSPEIGGLYKKTKSGIGLYDRVGGNGFLYTDQKSGKKRLILGQGEEETSVSATARYKSKEETMDLGDAVWEDVFDGTRNGKLNGTKTPRIKVISVPDGDNSFDRSTLEKRVNFEKEKYKKDIGIICLTQRFGSDDLEPTFIPFNDTTAGWCDKTWHCHKGGNSTFNNISNFIIKR